MAVGRPVGPPTSITVASYDGIRGHPIRLAAQVWPLLPEIGDRGARLLMDKHSDWVTEIPRSGCPADVDTVGDLLRWSCQRLYDVPGAADQLSLSEAKVWVLIKAASLNARFSKEFVTEATSPTNKPP